MNGFLFILILVAIYLIGAIPTGIVLARIMGYQDVRGHGSGNIGATNVYRVAGKLPGLLTLLGDILKGWLPLMIYQVCPWHLPGPLAASRSRGGTHLCLHRGNHSFYFTRFDPGRFISTPVDSAARRARTDPFGHLFHCRPDCLASSQQHSTPAGRPGRSFQGPREVRIMMAAQKIRPLRNRYPAPATFS
ncbi:MAG: glycerol-3-phosphate acyltransferase [Desulfuromonadales bacterium]